MPGRLDRQLLNQSGIQNARAVSAGAKNTLYVIAGAGVSAGTILLQASPDRVNWVDIATRAVTTPGLTADFVDEAHRYLRTRISVTIVGGTVTVYIACAGYAPDEWEETIAP